MNWPLLQNSLLVSAATTAASLAAGFGAALFLGCVGSRWRNALLGMAVVALALPPFVVTNCWLRLLGQGGTWRGWLPWNILSHGGTVWILFLLTWPITLLLVLAAWEPLEAHHLEAEPALRGRALIRFLLLPMARPALALSTMLTFVIAFNNFAVPAILQTKVFPAELWVSFNTTFNYTEALALSGPLLAVPALLLLWLRGRGIVWPRLTGRTPPALLRRRIGKPWFLGAASGTGLLLFLSVALPLGELSFSRRTWQELPGAISAGWPAVWNSFSVSAATASLCGLLALNLWRCRWGAAFWLPFLAPGVLLGIGFIHLFNRPLTDAFYQSMAVVIVALAVRYFAPGWTGIRHAMQATDPDLTDAATLDGASAWQRFSRIEWPQIAPTAGAVWYATYLLCLWDVETLLLIAPPGGETLGLRIFNLLHYGHNAQVNALCLTLLALAVAPLVLWRAGVAALGVIRSSPGAARFDGAAAMLALALVLPGCGGRRADETALKSALFSSVRIIGSQGTTLGQFNKPRSVAVDAMDNLYVVDMTGRVQKFSSNGVFLAYWQMPQTDLGRPKGMCRDSDGNIVVVEPHYQQVNHFTPEGRLTAHWGTRGTNAGQLTLPRAAAVTSHGDILVSEYTVVDRVQRFTKNGGKFLNTFGTPGTHEGGFNRAEGLGIDSKDRVYVADSCNHRIQVFTPEGKFLRAFGHAGSGLGELSYPYDVQVDSAGYQFVCEFGNSRVQVFDPDGKPVEIIGRAGAAPGEFNNPWGVALDSQGNLYVADSRNHRVQKLLRRKPAGP
jgi:ABC-type Fe3+ transport system permease subunit/DNA-binding beta-propeller fold protein YncE